MIELDFGPGLRPGGGRRHLASEGEFELLTEYFRTSVLFRIDGETVFDADQPLLNFAEMAALTAQGAAEGREVRVAPEFGGSGAWSVVPSRERVRVEFRRYLPEEKRDLTGVVSAGRVELASAMGAFTLRAVAAAEAVDASVAQNPWTRRIRTRTHEMLSREMDRSIVSVDMTGPPEHAPDAEGLAARLARRVWSYGGLPDAVPGPVRVEVLADAGARRVEVTGTEMAGAPVVEAITPPGVAGDAEVLADAVWPGVAEVLEVFGAASHPLYRAARRP